MSITDSNYLKELFIDEAKPALNRHTYGGYDEGYEAGKQANNDEWWDAFVKNKTGVNGLDCASAFVSWSGKMFYPSQDLRIGVLSSAFKEFASKDEEPVDLKARIEECGVVFDTSKVYGGTSYLFYKANISHFPVLDLSNATSIQAVFLQNRSVETIEKLVLSSKKVQPITESPFGQCSNLRHIIFEGTIWQSLSLEWSTLLDKESITSAMAILADSVSDQAITFSLIAVNKAFETSKGANDGSAATEWKALVEAKPNWTVSLV